MVYFTVVLAFHVPVANGHHTQFCAKNIAFRIILILLIQTGLFLVFYDWLGQGSGVGGGGAGGQVWGFCSSFCIMT